MTTLRPAPRTPATTGEWNRIARKHYQHIDGNQVRYNHNKWAWEVIGGTNSGEMYKTLTDAQHAAEGANSWDIELARMFRQGGRI